MFRQYSLNENGVPYLIPVNGFPNNEKVAIRLPCACGYLLVNHLPREIRSRFPFRFEVKCQSVLVNLNKFVFHRLFHRNKLLAIPVFILYSKSLVFSSWLCHRHLRLLCGKALLLPSDNKAGPPVPRNYLLHLLYLRLQNK